MSNSESKYDKNTYIGYLKVFNGGMKVIPGDIDNKIIHNRDRILDHLNLVLSGGKQLKEKNVEKYFKALGGKYIRSKMNLPESTNVNGGSNKTVSSAHKLLKHASKNNFNISNILDIFRGSAPQLYDKLETKISGGQVRDTGSVYSNSSRRSSYRSEGGAKSMSTKSTPSAAALKTYGKFEEVYTADFREIIKDAGLNEDYIIGEDFFDDNPNIRKKVIENLKRSINSSQGVGLKTQKGTASRSYRDIMAFFYALSSAYKNETDMNYIAELNNIIKNRLMPILVNTKFRDVDDSISGIEWTDKTYVSWIQDNFPTIYNSVYGSKGGYDDYRHGSYRSEGGYNDYRRDSYRSNNSRRSSYRSEGGKDKYVDTFSSKHKGFDLPDGFKYHSFLEDKNNKTDRNSLVDEYRSLNGVPSVSNGIIYAAAIEAKWVRNKLCEGGNQDVCNKTKAEMYVLARKLYNQLTTAYPNTNIDEIFEDEAPNLFTKIKDPRSVFDGYDSRRSSYRSEGGYNDYRRDSYRSDRGGATTVRSTGSTGSMKQSGLAFNHTLNAIENGILRPGYDISDIDNAGVWLNIIYENCLYADRKLASINVLCAFTTACYCMLEVINRVTNVNTYTTLLPPGETFEGKNITQYDLYLELGYFFHLCNQKSLQRNIDFNIPGSFYEKLVLQNMQEFTKGRVEFTPVTEVRYTQGLNFDPSKGVDDAVAYFRQIERQPRVEQGTFFKRLLINVYVKALGSQNPSISNNDQKENICNLFGNPIIFIDMVYGNSRDNDDTNVSPPRSFPKWLFNNESMMCSSFTQDPDPFIQNLQRRYQQSLRKGGYYRPDNYRSNDNRQDSYRSEGGYNDYRPDYRSNGGYNNYRPDYNRGGSGMDDDDYEGGYRNRYYSDNMHGGALGEFRKEIGRNLFNNNINKLREDILNIDLD
jgi:hypothetical protein